MQLAKSLPQRLRHRLGPAQEFAEGFLAAEQPGGVSMAEAMIRYARREQNLVIPLDAFRPETVPPHLWMNWRVVDEHGRQLAMGRNLSQLRAELGEQAREQFEEAVEVMRARLNLPVRRIDGTPVPASTAAAAPA